MAQFSIPVALVLLMVIAPMHTPAWSQQNQAGQAGTAGTVGQPGAAGASQPAGPISAAQSGTPAISTNSDASTAPRGTFPGQAGPGQTGASDNFGRAGQSQGQFTPSGQPIHRPFANQFLVPFGGRVINGAPGFFPQGVAQPGLPQNQFNQFNIGAPAGDNQAAATPPSVPGARPAQAAGAAQPQGIGGLAGMLTAPTSRRYYQLNWQQLGYRPFTDPIFQRQLHMSAQQQQDFQLLANRWDQKIRMLELYEGANAALTDQRFAELREQSRELINSQLTPNQERLWVQLVGPDGDVAVASDNNVDDWEDDHAPFR